VALKWAQSGIANFVGLDKQYDNMPRPKPLEPLKNRAMRLSDRHMLIFKELGGIDWLRNHLDKKAKMPAKYYRLELDAPSKKEIND
jgi:hypothetical protein